MTCGLPWFGNHKLKTPMRARPVRKPKGPYLAAGPFDRKKKNRLIIVVEKAAFGYAQCITVVFFMVPV